MRKSMLPAGPLPSTEETEVYLRKELHWIPHNVPLSLATALPCLPETRKKVLTARTLCILAIWGNETHALSTDGILKTMIGEGIYSDPDAAKINGPGQKRTGWVVRSFCVFLLQCIVSHFARRP